jgi:hypothetical protein
MDDHDHTELLNRQRHQQFTHELGRFQAMYDVLGYVVQGDDIESPRVQILAEDVLLQTNRCLELLDSLEGGYPEVFRDELMETWRPARRRLEDYASFLQRMARQPRTVAARRLPRLALSPAV